MDLRDLIAANKRGRSYDRLAEDCGSEPSRQRLHQLATVRQKQFPSTDTIRGLSRGLGVSVQQVILAAAESVGFSMDRVVPNLVNYLPAKVSALSNQQMVAIGELIRAFVDDPEVARMRPDHDEMEQRRERRAQFLAAMADSEAVARLQDRLSVLTYEAEEGSWGAERQDEWDQLWDDVDFMMALAERDLLDQYLEEGGQPWAQETAGSEEGQGSVPPGLGDGPPVKRPNTPGADRSDHQVERRARKS